MDPVTVAFYAVVCGLLAGLLPARFGRGARLGIGAAVGLVSALALPPLRGVLGL